MTHNKRFAASLLTAAMVLTSIPTVSLAASKGWQEQDDTWIYVLSDGSNATGWKKISKKWYYFDQEGLMQKGLHTIDGKIYLFDKSGAMKTGWRQDEDKNWYYFRSGGDAIVSKWYKTGGVWYYFDEAGVMVTGLQTIDGVLYNFKSSGALMSGWYQVEEGAKSYFTTNGVVRGWKKIDNVWYYFDEENAQMITGFREIDGELYMFEDSGVMYSARWYMDEEENWYYFTKSGAAYRDNEWHKIGNDLFLFDENGILIDEQIDPNSLHNSVFNDPYTKNNEDICTWAWIAYENNWGYMYGTYGNILTKSKLDSMCQQHPNDVGKYRSIIEQTGLGRRTCDCVGLIKGYLWYDPSKEDVVYGYGGSLDAGANAT